eukprot:GFUD01012594.1.p1 GENE.GFUD01012594.1~~GFUD01012594.1.p1  ORF type:complete len:180 (-),score=29.40 GFUD01012594.1:84-623(-)
MTSHPQLVVDPHRKPIASLPVFNTSSCLKQQPPFVDESAASQVNYPLMDLVQGINTLYKDSAKYNYDTPLLILRLLAGLGSLIPVVWFGRKIMILGQGLIMNTTFWDVLVWIPAVVLNICGLVRTKQVKKNVSGKVDEMIRNWNETVGKQLGVSLMTKGKFQEMVWKGGQTGYIDIIQN